MVVFLHVVIAVLSIIFAGYLYMRPSRKGLTVSYSLMAATLGSGFYLVLSAPAHMIEACLMGVAYLVIVSTMTVASRVKLASREVSFSRIK
ncbi:hypothetical protein D3C85_1063020 [compost metagenome]